MPVKPDYAALLDDAAADPLDWSDRFNTPLSDQDEKSFQKWLLSTKRAQDLKDYDLRGAWAAGIARDGRGHLPDTWKKPNHPTFSTESRYHGVQQYEGGTWRETAPKKWEFSPSSTNLELHGELGLSEYFKRVEPGSVLRH